MLSLLRVILLCEFLYLYLSLSLRQLKADLSWKICLIHLTLPYIFRIFASLLGGRPVTREQVEHVCRV